MITRALVVDRPVHNPGHCWFCHHTPIKGFECTGQVIDTGREVNEFAGLEHVYICFDCARYFGKLAGCLEPKPRAKLEGRVDRAEGQVVELRDELEESRSTLRLATDERIQELIGQYAGAVGSAAAGAASAGA
jgi:hypothetical protein